ncbi:hypothetical protein GTA09_25550 [Rhodococcus hoagii]|nr:hypothetical protein [Prescottella equi]
MQFKDGATNMGGPVAVVNGTATAQTSFTTAGGHSINRSQRSTGFKSSTSSAQTVTVSAPVVQTSLTLSRRRTHRPGPAAITFTAAVTPANAARHRAVHGRRQQHRGGVTVSNGVATLPYTFSAAGVHSVGASFAGAAGFTNSSATSRRSRCPSRPRRTSSRRRPSPCRRRPPWDSRDAVGGGVAERICLARCSSSTVTSRSAATSTSSTRCRDGSAHLRYRRRARDHRALLGWPGCQGVGLTGAVRPGVPGSTTAVTVAAPAAWARSGTSPVP